jgi:hypothetical protein
VLITNVFLKLEEIEVSHTVRIGGLRDRGKVVSNHPMEREVEKVFRCEMDPGFYFLDRSTHGR